MKLILLTIMILSLGLLTACGGSGGSSGIDNKAVPIGLDPVATNELDSLLPTINENANEYNYFALAIPEYKDTHEYKFVGLDADKIELSREREGVLFKTPPSLDTHPVYNFIMTVTNVAQQTKDINVTISIVDVDSDLDDWNSSIEEEVSENQRLALIIPEHKLTNTYEFSGEDGDKVKLWPERGEVLFKYAPDYEDEIFKNVEHPTYKFIMTVTNAEGQSKNVDVTIKIKDVTPDFIFKVLPGSYGSLSLMLNSDDQKLFEEYSFTVKKDGDLYYSVDNSGDNPRSSLVIKGSQLEVNETHTFTITPTLENGLPEFVFFPNRSLVKIMVMQWGDNPWKSMNGMFSDICYRGDAADVTALFFSESQSAPNLIQMASMSSALNNCDLVESLPYWDVSNVINMNNLFPLGSFSALDPSILNVFNQDISQWDTSSVESMNNMFYETELFDQDISGWNVENVIECDGFKEGALLLSDAHTPNFQSCSQSPAP
jgi:hypothetical protein